MKSFISILVEEFEHEKRHRIAQQNAALPVEQGGLGLPKDNNAMDRARAMGFDTTEKFYHGTSKDFSAFKPKEYKKGQRKTMILDIGTHFTTDKDYANNYSMYAAGVFDHKHHSTGASGDGEPVVYPVYLKDGKQLDLTKPITDKNVMDKIMNKRDEHFQTRKQQAITLHHVQPLDIIQTLQPKMGRKSLEKFVRNTLGFDSIKYWNNMKVTLNPHHIRSVNAAFDPLRQHESDLLA